MKSGLTTEKAVVKLKLSKPTPTAIENYQNLQQIWKQEQMSSYKDFLRWYNNKYVVPTLEALQKMITFYHDTDIDMLKLGSTLPNLATICLHTSTDAKFYPFTEGDKDLLEKFPEYVAGGVFGSLQTHANLMLEVMPANKIPYRFVINAQRSSYALGYRFRNQ